MERVLSLVKKNFGTVNFNKILTPKQIYNKPWFGRIRTTNPPTLFDEYCNGVGTLEERASSVVAGNK